MALIPPPYLDAVVAIGKLDLTNSSTQWVGTGFLVGDVVSREGETVTYRPYLVTNRHVAKAATSLQLRFNTEADRSTRQFELDASTTEGQVWYFHPNPNLNVDVAVAPINGQALKDEGIRFSVFLSDVHCLKRQDAFEAGITEGDQVFVLGFPMGMVGSSRNYVIVRQGCLARVTDALAGDEVQFLIDASVFPGNSGSPVITSPQFGGIDNTKTYHRASLIGIITSYVPYRDMAISSQTGRPRVTFEENSGLALVTPFDFIDETIQEHRRQLPGDAEPTGASVTPSQAPPEDVTVDNTSST